MSKKPDEKLIEAPTEDSHDGEFGGGWDAGGLDNEQDTDTPREEEGAGGDGAAKADPPVAAGEQGADGEPDAEGQAGDGGETDAAGAAEQEQDTPPADDESAAGEEGEPEGSPQGDDAPKEGTLDARIAKMERDFKAEIGRLRKENRELRAMRTAPQAQRRDEPGQKEAAQSDRSAALLEKLGEPLKKIREYDEDTAAALETVARELSSEISASEQRFQKQSKESLEEQRLLAESRQFDEAFPDGFHNDLLQFDESGQATDPDFQAFLDSLPFAQARKFYETDDPKDVIAVLKSYQTRDDPPADKAGEGSPPPKKPANDTPKRRAQARAGAAVKTGSSGQTDKDLPSDGSYDDGWNIEDVRLRKLAEQQSARRHAFA